MRSRLPRHYRWIPRPLIRWIEKTICQEEMNSILEKTAGLTGAEFCSAVLRELNVTYRVHGAGNLPAGRRVTIVSNHPLGGLDGIALIDLVAQKYGSRLKFIVNDLLMAVEPLRPVFLPINKHGAQSRESREEIDKAFAGDDPILIFPAGLVSRKISGTVTDLEWKKMFITRSVASKRDIIPVFFSGRNSGFFYNFAKMRALSGLRLNIEMFFLPREVFRCRNKCFDIYIGAPIGWNTLRSGKDAGKDALRVREAVYSLPSAPDSSKP